MPNLYFLEFPPIELQPKFMNYSEHFILRRVVSKFSQSKIWGKHNSIKIP